ncbi:ABC-ATPase domain-containing protein [cf. Phormidesmis sp. LEGE 11477]|nr:ABC-ATPase domain-containing protein [cf. Phormidesmis sp. LEGE 11477]
MEQSETWTNLRHQLKDLDGQSYREYKRIKGNYGFPEFKLSIDYVQGDPFAAPSRLCIRVSQTVAGFPVEWITDYASQVAIADYLTRQVAQVAQLLQKKRGSGKSGKIEIAAPSQAILRRTAIWPEADAIELRLTVGLPAFGRRIAGMAAAALLCEDIPQLVSQCLKYEVLDSVAIERHIHTLKDAESLRAQLAEKGLVAFVAAASCLPRRSGVDERPLNEAADLFVPPADSCIALETPYSGRVQGLGIRAGVTLIVGGGYHGKSTLLRAIEQGIYSHVPGDGREQVVSDARTVKLRAEDGRSVVGVDISPVINHLPRGRDSRQFSTTNASGSTSQAAGLLEAVEAGAKVLLIDEDTAATNFMIRDRKMQALIAKDKEPITPFVDKVRQLYDDYGISTILVIGGSGDYFDVADTVIAMEDYQPKIVTTQAKAIANADPNPREQEGDRNFGPITPRAVLPGSLPDSLPSRSKSNRKGDRTRPLKAKARRDSLILGNETIDLKAIEQIAEVHQVNAIAQAIIYADRYYFAPERSFSELLDLVMDDIERGGLDALLAGSTPVDRPSNVSYRLGNLAMFRRFELAAAINRLRTVRIEPIKTKSVEITPI